MRWITAEASQLGRVEYQGPFRLFKGWIVQFVDGGDEQPVGGVDVAVEQVVGDGGRERAARAGVSAAGRLQQAGGVA